MYKKIITITLSLAILLPTFSVPAKAQNPPSPKDSGNFMWGKADYGSLKFIGQINGTEKQYEFPIDSKLTWSNEQLPNSNKKYFSIKGYRLPNNTTLKCAKVPCSTDQMPFMAVGFDENKQTNATLIGMYFYEVRGSAMSGTFYATGSKNDPGAKLTKLVDTNITEVFGNRSTLSKEIIPLVAWASENRQILLNLSSTDLEGLCTSLKTNWEITQKLIRNFFIPAPGAGATTSVNENWTNKRDGWGKRMLSGETIRNHFLNGAEYIGLPESYLNNATTDEWKVSETGERNATAILSNIADMKEIVANLKQQSGSSTKLDGATSDWPCGIDFQPTEFKWDITLPASPITTLDDFSKSLTKIDKSFNQFKSTIDDPGDGGICSPNSSDKSILPMIQEAFCALTALLNGWADSAFTWASDLMMTVIGITNDEKDTDKNIKDITAPN